MMSERFETCGMDRGDDRILIPQNVSLDNEAGSNTDGDDADQDPKDAFQSWEVGIKSIVDPMSG